MSHVYTLTSITKVDDQITVVGNVDGILVRVQFSASTVAGLSQQDKIKYVAALMLSALPPTPIDITAQFPSSFTI